MQSAPVSGQARFGVRVTHSASASTFVVSYFRWSSGPSDFSFTTSSSPRRHGPLAPAPQPSGEWAGHAPEPAPDQRPGQWSRPDGLQSVGRLLTTRANGSCWQGRGRSWEPAASPAGQPTAPTERAAPAAAAPGPAAAPGRSRSWPVGRHPTPPILDMPQLRSLRELGGPRALPVLLLPPPDWLQVHRPGHHRRGGGAPGRKSHVQRASSGRRGPTGGPHACPLGSSRCRGRSAGGPRRCATPLR